MNKIASGANAIELAATTPLEQHRYCVSELRVRKLRTDFTIYGRLKSCKKR